MLNEHGSSDAENPLLDDEPNTLRKRLKKALQKRVVVLTFSKVHGFSVASLGKRLFLWKGGGRRAPAQNFCLATFLPSGCVRNRVAPDKRPGLCTAPGLCVWYGNWTSYPRVIPPQDYRHETLALGDSADQAVNHK